MARITRSYMGKGTIYAEEIGASSGLLTLGNCNDLTLNINFDKKEQQDFETAGGATTDSVSRVTSVEAVVNSLNLSPENLSLALRAVLNSVAGGAQVSEPHLLYTDAFVPFNFLPDTSVAVDITGSGGTPTYALGTDVELKNAGLRHIEGGTIPDGTAIELTYTSLSQYNIEGLADSGKEYNIFFDGLNEADSGKPVTVQLHRVKFTPTQALALISDEFGELPLQMDVLKDTGITGVGESKFVKISMTQ